MIHINRNIFPVPAVFYSKEIGIAKKRLEDFYGRPKESRTQEKYSKPFEKELRDKFLKALREVFNGKCAYCESIIPLEIIQSEYDHFRPKSGARGFEKEFSTDHYWWLSYDWNNLYYCCSKCNQYKSTWFPIDGNRTPLNTPYNEIILHEKALLVDPCLDNPEEHFLFNDQGEIDFLSAKGKTTIEIIKLNRSELVDARRNVIAGINKEWARFNELLSDSDKNMTIINEFAESWRSIFSKDSTRPYLAIQRQILTNFFKESGINDYLSNRGFKVFQASEILKGETLKFSQEEIEKSSNRIELTPEQIESISQTFDLEEIRHIYVESIELKNFKCFSNLKLNFPHESNLLTKNPDSLSNEPWLLFLGENGVGKSSLLKAFAIGLTGKEYIKDLGIKGEDLLKHNEESGYIKINLVGGKKPIEVNFDKNKIETSLFQPIVNIVAYNSIRLKPQVGKMVPENIEFYGAKVKNLFDYTFSLVDADNWLSTLPKEIFDRTALTLKDLMLLDSEDTILVDNYTTFVKRGDNKFLIDELSDGYKSVFYLAVDIMATLADENVTFDLAEGIVLIDEIGTHLHPRWRMEVVGRLRKAFPKIRFVVTTHEPLCLRGLRYGEAVVLTKDSKNEIIALTDLPDPSELRVDQILTSDFFGLKSTIDPKTEKLFDEYYSILAIDEDKKTEQQKNRLLDLNMSIPKIKHLGDNLRDEIIYYVVDELLAKKTRTEGPKLTIDIKEEAIKRVNSLWKLIESENKGL